MSIETGIIKMLKMNEKDYFLNYKFHQKYALDPYSRLSMNFSTPDNKLF